jgi:DNA-binding NtrC family response regulator
VAGSPSTSDAIGPALAPRLSGEKIRTILVVDDAHFLTQGLQRALRSAGFESICVTSGAHALTALQHYPIALVLTDLRMPAMSGEELLELLQRERPDLPCIVMTGYATRECITHVAQMPNVAGVLVKPLEYNRLFSALAGIVGLSPER